MANEIWADLYIFGDVKIKVIPKLYEAICEMFYEPEFLEHKNNPEMFFLDMKNRLYGTTSTAQNLGVTGRIVHLSGESVNGSFGDVDTILKQEQISYIKHISGTHVVLPEIEYFNGKEYIHSISDAYFNELISKNVVCQILSKVPVLWEEFHKGNAPLSVVKDNNYADNRIEVLSAKFYLSCKTEPTPLDIINHLLEEYSPTIPEFKDVPPFNIIYT